MKLANMHELRAAFCSLMLLSFARAEDGYYNTYCSTENTGSNTSPQYNTYNSMGSCYTHCSYGNYAFAILQWKDCWCSDYIPANQASVSQCNEACPGFGTDECGNKSAGLYGYVALQRQPLGTAGASRSPTKTKTTQSPTPPPPTSSSPVSPTVIQTQTQIVQDTIQHTVTETPTPRISIVITPSSSSPPSSSSSSTSPASSTTATHVTISGPGTTQTVTTTPTVVAPGSSSDQPSLERKAGLSPGATAGIVVGTLIGAAAIILGGFLFWRRRQSGDNESGTGSTRSHRSPKRKGSVLSRTGLLGGARPQSTAEMSYDDPFNDSQAQSNSVRHSIMFGAGASADGIRTAGPLASSSREGSGSERRPSRPLVYDQRLNPSALFANFDNGSRVSMQDQNDYSRPLGVANPDFRYSFDSR